MKTIIIIIITTMMMHHDEDDDNDENNHRVSGFGRITEDVMMMMGDSHVTRILYYGYFSWTWLVVSPGLLLVSTARGVHVRHTTLVVTARQ